MLTNLILQRIKTDALRRRVWYKTLSRMERSIMDLTIRCVKRVQSKALANALLAVVDKLLQTLQAFPTRAEKIGRKIAEKICEIAHKWGNIQAQAWEHDINFIRFVGMTALNSSEI